MGPRENGDDGAKEDRTGRRAREATGRIEEIYEEIKSALIGRLGSVEEALAVSDAIRDGVIGPGAMYKENIRKKVWKNVWENILAHRNKSGKFLGPEDCPDFCRNSV